jgi:hypothetical protein
MNSASILKEALISGITAGVVIPLLWVAGAAINPERDTHSPGLDLIALTLAGAVMVMLLRSTWRDTAEAFPDHDYAAEEWDWRRLADSYGGGHC